LENGIILGNNAAVKIASMATATNNSTKVKPFFLTLCSKYVLIPFALQGHSPAFLLDEKKPGDYPRAF
jgi:hypothetical protein